MENALKLVRYFITYYITYKQNDIVSKLRYGTYSYNNYTYYLYVISPFVVLSVPT